MNEDADLWEELVASGVPKEEATRRVQARRVDPSGFGGAGEGRSFGVGEGRSFSAPGNAVTGAARSAVQGATLGFGDEMEGAVSAVGALVPGGRSPGQAYRQDTDLARQDLTNFRREHPNAAFIAEVGGGLATGAALGRGASTAASRTYSPEVQRVVDAVRRVGSQPAAQGAAVGAVAGAGSANGGVGDRLRGAAVGGALGGAAGGALQATGLVRGPTTRAQGQVLRSVPGGLDELRAAVSGARPGEMLMEVGGPQLLKKARAAESIPSEGSDRIRAALQARDEEAPDMVKGALQREAGMSFENAVATSSDLMARRRTSAAPLYDAAYAAEPIRDPELLKVFEIPAFRSALERAQRIAAAEGVDLPLPSAEGGVSIRALDLTKRGLDDLIESQMRGGAMGRTEARALRNRLNEVLTQADAAVPEYGAARQQFAGDSSLEQAFAEAREEFLDLDPREIAAKLASMTEGEAELYRRGALDALSRRMERSADGRDLTKVIGGNPEMRERVRLLFGDDEEAFARFSDSMGSLRSQKDNKNFVLGGSVTSRLKAEQEDLVGQPWKISDVVHPVKTAEKAIDKGVATWQRGATQGTIDAMAPILTARDEELRKVVEALLAHEKKQAGRRQLTGQAARTAGVSIGLGAGRDDP